MSLSVFTTRPQDRVASGDTGVKGTDGKNQASRNAWSAQMSQVNDGFIIIHYVNLFCSKNHDHSYRDDVSHVLSVI